jgi:hypothetical protein
VLINKDFATWEFPPDIARSGRKARSAEPRFTVAELAYIRSFPAIVVPDEEESDAVYTEAPALHPEAPTIHPLKRRRDTPEAPALQSHIEERARGEGRESKERVPPPSPEPLPPKWRGLPDDYIHELRRARDFALSSLKDKGGAAIAKYIEDQPRPVDGMPGWWWTVALGRMAARTAKVDPTTYLYGMFEGFCTEKPKQPKAPPAAPGGTATPEYFHATPEELERIRAHNKRAKGG